MGNPSVSGVRPPYKQPADNRRPHGSHKFVVYSLKAQRRMVLYGIRALDTWVALEADPAVTQLCERPLVIRDVRPHRVVDFWVAGPAVNRFIFLVRDGELNAAEKRHEALAAFRAWSKDVGCDIEEIPHERTTPRRACWLANWTQMLQQAKSYQPFVSSDLVDRVRELCSGRRSIREIREALTDADTDTARAAIYLCAHAGHLRFVDLESELLSDALEVEPT